MNVSLSDCHPKHKHPSAYLNAIQMYFLTVNNLLNASPLFFLLELI